MNDSANINRIEHSAGDSNMKKTLYLTDLAYQAKGRNYCEED
ncbi:hypothetical protein [Ruminococcus sp.]